MAIKKVSDEKRTAVLKPIKVESCNESLSDIFNNADK